MFIKHLLCVTHWCGHWCAVCEISSNSALIVIITMWPGEQTIRLNYINIWASLVAQTVKNPPILMCEV